MTQFVVTIAYTTEEHMYRSRRDEALGFVGTSETIKESVYLSYVDTLLVEPGGVPRSIIPCVTLWDISGCRLSAVLLLDLAS